MTLRLGEDCKIYIGRTSSTLVLYVLIYGPQYLCKVSGHTECIDS